MDVPGHNSGFSSHEAIADDAMRSCDALIAVLLADAALGKVESDRLETALLDLEHQSVFIAVNKLDTLRPEQQTELIAEFPKRWARFLDSLDLPSEIKEPLRDRVYFIDSFNTLQRKLGRSAPDTGVKEFARLERDLAAMADGDLIAEKLDRPRRVLLRQPADLQRTIKDQYRLLDADAEKLLAHRQTIDGSIDKLERIASEIRRTCEEAGILRACRQSVRHAAEIRFTNYLDRLPAWARVGRADRPRPDGNRFMRLGPHRVRARIKLIAAELLNRFQKELLRFTEELASRGDGNDGASRPIWQALQDTYDLAEPALYEFEREIARMWQEVLSDPNARPPVADLRGAIQDLLKDFTGIPLEIQPVGVTTLIMRNVTERIQEIFLRLADPGGSSDASDLLKAVWELQQEITAGLQQLASVLVGTDAEVRNALDELLEKYACRAVAAALTDGTGNVATLAERYAANAERVVKNRQDALLGFLHDQTNRVRSLYDNTVRTVEAGLEEVRAKKAVLLEDSTRLTTLWSAFEEAR